MEDQECLDEFDPSGEAVDTCPMDDQVGEERSRNNSPVGQPTEPVSPSQMDGEHVSRQKNKMNKMKLLVRSHALREAASPPPDSPCASSPLLGAHEQQQQTPLVITLVESDDEVPSHQPETAHVAHRLRPRVQVESSQCSVDSSSSFVSFSLSRDSSSELANGSDCFLTVGPHSYTDNTGVDLQHFIEETLHRNYKDRMTLLRIEQDMIALVRDTKRTCHRFPAMSSYHRMLVHRVAAYFGMEHNVDQSGNCVVVSKSRHTRLPEIGFKEYVRDDVVLPEEPSRKLNPKRETVSFDEPQSCGRFGRSPEARSRSLDVERDGDIHRPRNRAFQPQVTWVSSPDGAMGARSKESLSESYNPVTSRHAGEEVPNLRWPKRFNQGTLRHHRIPKVESFDSRDLLCSYGNGLRPTVAKSYSFGGYTAASDAELASMRGENVINGAPTVYQPHLVNQGQNYNSRFLSKQDSNSSSISISRSSPTSSGYKSQQSAATSPTPVNRIPLRAQVTTTSCNSNCSNDSQNGYQEWTCSSRGCATNVGHCGTAGAAAEIVSTTPANTTLLWAVTSLDAVPPGSILINPQTGQPFYNADGSAYRYDPQLPLPFQVEGQQNGESAGEVEQAESYESYDRPETVVKTEESEGAAVAPVPVPVYPTWQQHSYESPLSPVMASPYISPAQPYFGPEFASFHTAGNAGPSTSHHPTNGFFVSPSTVTTASFDEHMKTNCVAVPVAHGNGYVLYQACLGPPGDDGELYSAMKNLSLRPISGVAPMSYPSVLTDGLAHPTEMSSTPSFMTAVPVRPVNLTNAKMPTTLSGSLPSRSGSTPPSTVTCAPSGSLASNAYLASIRVQSNGQMMHHQLQPYNGAANLATPYHPSMVYPLMNPASHQPVNRQHYFPSSIVHQLNNAQFVSSPWSLVTTSSAATNCGTPERDAPPNVDVPVSRMMAASPNRLSCLYGPSLPSPFLTGADCGGMRHSSTVLHRQFSLPSPIPQTMYTLRPRIQQQQLPTAMPVSSLSSRPVTSSVQTHPGGLNLSSRHAARTRRQVFRPHNATGLTSVTDPCSVMPLQSCSFSPVQHFPSSTS